MLIACACGFRLVSGTPTHLPAPKKRTQFEQKMADADADEGDGFISGV